MFETQGAFAFRLCCGLSRWLAIVLIHCCLSMSGALGRQQDASPPRSFDFELKKGGGDLLRVLSVYRHQDRTQAVAVAFQLKGTKKRRQEFDLYLYTDGSGKRKGKRFQAGKTLEFKARGHVQPFTVLVSQVGKHSIRGKIVPRHEDASIQIDFYSFGDVQSRAPHIYWPDPSKASNNRRVYHHSEVEGPVLLRGQLPVYTDSAIKAKVTGTMLLEGVVRKDGSVDSIRVIKALGYGLEEAAIEEIANHWHFRPGTLGGQPVDVWSEIEVTFSLR